MTAHPLMRRGATPTTLPQSPEGARPHAPGGYPNHATSIARGGSPSCAGGLPKPRYLNRRRGLALMRRGATQTTLPQSPEGARPHAPGGYPNHATSIAGGGSPSCAGGLFLLVQESRTPLVPGRQLLLKSNQTYPSGGSPRVPPLPERRLT